MKCYICHEQKDELIFPIIGDLTEENLCSNCCSQYENLLSIEENYENIKGYNKLTIVDSKIFNYKLN